MMNDQIKPGSTVVLNTDNWGDIGETARVVQVNATNILVEHNGVIRHLSHGQYTAQSFLAE